MIPTHHHPNPPCVCSHPDASHRYTFDAGCTALGCVCPSYQADRQKPQEPRGATIMGRRP